MPPFLKISQVATYYQRFFSIFPAMIAKTIVIIPVTGKDKVFAGQAIKAPNK